jgi:gliding motility-associated-like protein
MTVTFRFIGIAQNPAYGLHFLIIKNINMIKRLLFFLISVSPLIGKAQCPQVFNYLGTPTTNPVFINCTGGVYNLSFISNQSFGAYTINWGDGSPNTVGASYVANSTIPHTYPATVATYTLLLSIPSLGCNLSALVVNEKPVNASIQIPVGGITTACAPKTLTFTNSSTDVSANTTFTWSFGDGSPDVVFNSTNVGQSVLHTYQKNTVNCQTQVTLKALNYCSFGFPTIANFNPIQIYDVDDAQITPDALIKCWPDNSFTFNNTTNRNCLAQGNTFQRQEKWNFGNYWGYGHDSIFDWSPWPPSVSHVIAYPAVGSYSVMLLDSNLCGVDTAIIAVTIVNPPTAGILAPPGPFCQNVPVTFTNTSSPGYAYQWNFGQGAGFVNLGNGNKTFSFPTPGVFTVVVSASVPNTGAACTSTAAVTVTILPSPNANFTFAPNNGCNVLNNVAFVESSTLAVTWNWNLGNSNTSTLQIPPTQNYGAPGNYTVSLLVSSTNGCVNTKTATVIVHPTPIPDFTVNPTCVAAIANFTNISTVSGTNAINSYTWNFGDGSAAVNTQSASNTYTAPNTYTVKLIVATAFCSDSIKKTIVVNVKPTANFAFTPTVGCPPFNVNFNNTTLNGITYLWKFGSSSFTSAATSPSFTYGNSLQVNQDYTVTLIANTPAGCADSIKKVVTVLPKPVATFTGNLAGQCTPHNVTFTNTSIGGFSYAWNFGNGVTSSSLNPVAVFTNTTNTIPVTNTVQLIVSNIVGCKDTATQVVTTNPKPGPFVMIPAIGCTPLNVIFPSVPGVISYTWNFGDGGGPIVTPNNISHVFTNTTLANKTYTVKLIAQNGFGCIDSSFGSPLVFPLPVAGYSATPIVGCPPLSVTFSNTSQLNNTSSWNFANGQTSTLTNPGQVFDAPKGTPTQTFSVKLVIASVNNCLDSITKPIVLLGRPKAQFAVDTPLCSPKIMTFTNTSAGASTYNWDFGSFGVSTQTSPAVTFVNNFAFNQNVLASLEATDINGCKDTAKIGLIVHPKPQFFITALPDSGCTPLKVNFPVISGVGEYIWTFGDGNSSAAAGPTNTFVNVTTTSKTFTVQLIAKDGYGCADTPTTFIKVFPNPVAFFQADPLEVFVPNQAIQIFNLSTLASSFKWDFGDGGVSTVNNPNYTYTKAGEYQIVLIATSDKGCKDTFALPNKIKAFDETFVQMPNAFTPNGSGAPGGFYNPKDQSNDVFHPDIRGVSKYLLSIYSRWGELLFETKDPLEGWDGYYKGKLCTQDVYVWKIAATFIDGKSFNKAGDVLLLR